MNNERCENCKFVREDGYNYFCRRNAPVPVSARVLFEWAAWPTVELDDWCGQWEKKRDE